MTAGHLKAAFKFEGVVVKLDQLLPTKMRKKTLRQSSQYKTILASIREVGVIEPLMVHPHGSDKYLLLDGHVRVEALRELERDEALCLVSTDDEAYTFNNIGNPVAAVQANKMVLKALEKGVPEARIASALRVTVATVRHNRSLLNNICAEAIEILKDKPVARMTFGQFKRVTPDRQVEIAEVMVAAGTYTASYARGLVMATAADKLTSTGQPKRASKPDDISKMEHELHALERDFALLDETHQQNMMNLTFARTYLRKILENARVVRYLAQSNPDALAEFQRIVESEGFELKVA